MDTTRKYTKTLLAMSATIVFCWPVGIYSFIQYNKLIRADKIGDTETIERCKKHVKNAGIGVLAFYAIGILIGIIAG